MTPFPSPIGSPRVERRLCFYFCGSLLSTSAPVVICRLVLFAFHSGEPRGRARMQPSHCRMVGLLQSPRDRTGPARADRTEVDLAQPDHLRRSSAHEHLIRSVELVA